MVFCRKSRLGLTVCRAYSSARLLQDRPSHTASKRTFTELRGECLAVACGCLQRAERMLITFSRYHAHYSAQYAAGLSGAMIIYGPHNNAYDHDLGPIMLSDW